MNDRDPPEPLLASDRRRFQRYPIPLPIQVRPAESRAAWSVTDDISGGGVAFPYPHPLFSGTRVDIDLSLGGEQIKVLGRVTRSTPSGNGQPARVGVSFSSPDSRLRQNLGRQILRISDLRDTLAQEHGRNVSFVEAARRWAEDHAQADSDESSADHADPDTDLMVRTRAGDRAAYGELFSKHSSALVNFVYRFVRNRHLAEELAQDVFLQIFRARGQYEPRARFTTYLYRVATNVCLNQIRHLKLRNRVEPPARRLSDDGEEITSEPADESLPSAEERVAGMKTGERIQNVLDTLPENQKAALLLSRIDGLSYAVAAECLNTTESAIKSLVFRATRTLRQELADLLDPGEADEDQP